MAPLFFFKNLTLFHNAYIFCLMKPLLHLRMVTHLPLLNLVLSLANVLAAEIPPGDLQVHQMKSRFWDHPRHLVE